MCVGIKNNVIHQRHREIMKPSIYGLDQYGLSLKELLSLKNRMVNIRADIAYVDRKPLFPFSPEIRKKKLHELEKELFEKLKNIWPSKDFEIIGSKRRPGGISDQIRAADLKRFLNRDFIDYIWIDKIEGVKKLKIRKKELWFAVKAYFAIQIEGQTIGYQDVEERIVIVKAFDSEDAEQRLIKDFREYDEPYLNKYGEMVRWHFEKVVDVYEMIEDTIDPKGTEVFYEFKRRRMKPEYEWHPLKEMKKRKLKV